MSFNYGTTGRHTALRITERGDGWVWKFLAFANTVQHRLEEGE